MTTEKKPSKQESKGDNAKHEAEKSPGPEDVHEQRQDEQTAPGLVGSPDKK